MGASPRQTPSMVPVQYAHLQQGGSANASPSPIMNNQLRTSAVPQRVSTASPHPYSPAGQQFVSQASPSQPDLGIRPESSLNPYSQNSSFVPSYNQQYTNANRGSLGSLNGMPNPSMPQSQHPMQQPPQMYQQGRAPNIHPGMDMQTQMIQQQMRRQQQAQSNNLSTAQRMHNMSQNQNAMQRPPMTNANNQYTQGPGSGPGQSTGPQQPMQQARSDSNANRVYQSLVAFAHQKGFQLEVNPAIGDKRVHIIMIFNNVVKHGGYKKVTGMNHWPQVAQALQVNLAQYPGAPQQLKSTYEQNLLAFEDIFASQQAKQKAMMQQQQSQMDGKASMSPMKQMTPGSQLQSAPYMAQGNPSIPPNMQQQQNMSMKPVMTQPGMNGFANPGMQTPSSAQTRNGMSRPMDSASQRGSAPPPSSLAGRGGPSIATTASPAAPIPYEMPKEYKPFERTIDTYGGIGGLDQTPDSLAQLTSSISLYKPNVPMFHEMGLVDIHAITMSLQSGIQSETRLALDTLATLSVESAIQIDLRHSEDLVESLIDCAEEQVELLTENAAEVSDVMLITSYEDVVRGCRQERDGLLNVPKFGSTEYELDRAVERLICITTIIRNLSFIELNQPELADELVIKFLCTVVRYLGTRNMLLRTNTNTLDFMKDVITFLSNLAHHIEIPGKEQALCLIHFLLAFAPSSSCFNSTSDQVVFHSYDPTIHRYLPPAVDSLAKLLARDEPNRTFYKDLFTADTNSTPPYDLLTRSFGLAIAPIPANKRADQILHIVDARRPQLMQGMLAADILANLAPGFETNLTKSWLSSEDGFAQSLLHLITILSSTSAPTQRNAQQLQGVDEASTMSITLSGISVLKRLASKATDPNDPDSDSPRDGMIKQKSLLGALLLTQPRAEVIKQLCAYAAIGK